MFFVRFRRRHDFVRILVIDVLDDFALRGIARHDGFLDGAFADVQAQPDVGGGFHPVDDVIDAEFFGERAALVGGGVITVETGGDFL